VRNIAIDGGPAIAVAQESSVWVATHRDTLVYRLDPASGASVATVQTDPAKMFDHLGALYPGIGGLWAIPFAIDSGTSAVVRFDATTNAVTASSATARLTDLGVDAIADTPMGVWGATRSQAPVILVKLDRTAGTELSHVEIPSLATNHALLVAFGKLWFAGIGDNSVERLDIGTGAIEATAAIPGPGVVGLAASDRALYVISDDATVARLDPASACVTAWRRVGGRTGDAIVGIGDSITVAATSKALFVGFDRGALAILDPTSLDLVGAYRLDYQDYQGEIAVAGGSVWYPTFGSNSVLEVRP